MRELTSKEVREDFSTAVNEVAFGSQRVVVTRRGRRLAAMVPLADLEQLEAADARRANVCAPAIAGPESR